ncbi:MAG TPA: hypothetical protein VIE40_08650 [Dehalococcoidia bacterium]
MRHKLIATVLGVGLIGLAAVGAFASQDGVQTNVQTPTATSTAPAPDTATATNTPIGTATATPAPEETPAGQSKTEGTEGPESERTIKGIPTDNPNHHPDNGDGMCEKGETAIKTTPSGVKVNVPCQAAGHTNNGDHGTPEADDTETPDD